MKTICKFDDSTKFVRAINENGELTLMVGAIAITDDNHALMMAVSGDVADQVAWIKTPIITDGKRILASFGMVIRKLSKDMDSLLVGIVFEKWYGEKDSNAIFRAMATTTTPEEAVEIYKANYPTANEAWREESTLEVMKLVAAEFDVARFTPTLHTRGNDVQLEENGASRAANLAEDIVNSMMACSVEEAFFISAQAPVYAFLAFVRIARPTIDLPDELFEDNAPRDQDDRVVEEGLMVFNSYGIETSFEDDLMMFGVDKAIDALINHLDYIDDRALIAVCRSLFTILNHKKRKIDSAVDDMMKADGTHFFGKFSVN